MSWEEGSNFQHHLTALKGTVEEMPFRDRMATVSTKPPRSTLSWLSGGGAAHECTAFTELPIGQEVAPQTRHQQDIVDLERATGREVTSETDAVFCMSQLLCVIGHAHNDWLWQVSKVIEVFRLPSHVLIRAYISNLHVASVISCCYVDHVDAGAGSVDRG